jgi:nucleoid DNA-binding protein
MNKSDLITGAMKRGGLGRGAARRGVEAALEIIKRELGESGAIQIRGLGRVARP